MGFFQEETLLAAWADAADGHGPDGSFAKRPAHAATRGFAAL